MLSVEIIDPLVIVVVAMVVSSIYIYIWIFIAGVVLCPVVVPSPRVLIFVLIVSRGRSGE